MSCAGSVGHGHGRVQPGVPGRPVTVLCVDARTARRRVVGGVAVRRITRGVFAVFRSQASARYWDAARDARVGLVPPEALP